MWDHYRSASPRPGAGCLRDNLALVFESARATGYAALLRELLAAMESA